jgi:DNA polymerase I-like protein with 3'-5' exonuclease and polymerase domains
LTIQLLGPEGLVTVLSAEVVGVYPVHDISVERDESYTSEGIFSHNSSATKPNLQNIAQRKARAKIVKRQFICELYNVFIKKDFSAHEIRVWGISAKDPLIAQTFWLGMKVRLMFVALKSIPKEDRDEWVNFKLKSADVHRINYGMLYGVKPETVNDMQRESVKGSIFGVVYGMSYGALAARLMLNITKRIKEVELELKKIQEELDEA